MHGTEKHTEIYQYIDTVLPPNSRFMGPGFFREFEIRELKIHNFPHNSL